MKSDGQDLVAVLNRSAIVVKPKQPFLDWLHKADPTSDDLTLEDVSNDPAIYLIPIVTPRRIWLKSCGSYVRRFSKSSWQVGTTTKLPGLRTVGLRSSLNGLIFSTIRC